MSNDHTDNNDALGTLGALAQQALDAAKAAQRDNHTGPGPLSDARHAYELANDALTQARETAEVAAGEDLEEDEDLEADIFRDYLNDVDDYAQAEELLNEAADILRAIKP